MHEMGEKQVQSYPVQERTQPLLTDRTDVTAVSALHMHDVRPRLAVAHGRPVRAGFGRVSALRRWPGRRGLTVNNEHSSLCGFSCRDRFGTVGGILLCRRANRFASHMQTG